LSVAKRSEQSELNCTECIHCDAHFKVQRKQCIIASDSLHSPEPPAKQVSERWVMGRSPSL